jgi:hypothetical protein
MNSLNLTISTKRSIVPIRILFALSSGLGLVADAQQTLSPDLQQPSRVLEIGTNAGQQMPGMKMPSKGKTPGKQKMPGMEMPAKQKKPMAGMGMKGTLGEWPMSREGSGTTWQPESSPMFMKDLPSLGGFDFGVMGTCKVAMSIRAASAETKTSLRIQ